MAISNIGDNEIENVVLENPTSGKLSLQIYPLMFMGFKRGCYDK